MALTAAKTIMFKDDFALQNLIFRFLDQKN
jgi:hypothetical protein